MTPPPGTYRGLFKEALKALTEKDGTSNEKKNYIQHYLVLLDNTDYKFGKVEYTMGHASSNEVVHPYFQ